MVIGQIALLTMILVPLVLGVALMSGDRIGGRAVPHGLAWALAMAGSAVALVAALAAAAFQPEVDRAWVPQLGLRLHLLVDGISAPLVVLSAAVTLLAVAISARQRPRGSAGVFYGSLLTVLGASVATFAAADALVFFLAFETVLVPMWVLIDRYGDPAQQRRRAGWTFLLYTVLGSMLMLVGLLVLSGAAGTSDLGGLTAAAAALPFSTKMIAAVLLTVGLAVKVPLLGVHTWLPRAHTAAPTAGSMVLAGVLLKLGTYGFVRLVVLPLPDAWRRIAPVVAVLAVCSILVGGLVCLVERDLKRLVAWSSISHMGFVMLALASGDVLGLQAALFGNVAHGVISALLFAVVGVLKEREGSVDLDRDAVGLRNRDPRLGLAVVFGFAAAMGVPGLAGFWGETLSIFSAWGAIHRPARVFMPAGALAGVGTVLTAAYALRVLRVVWQGEAAPTPLAAPVLPEGASEPPASTSTAGPDRSAGATPASVAGEHARPVAEPRDDVQLHGVELVVVSLLCLAVVLLGIGPSALLHVSVHDVAHLLGGHS